MHKLVQNTMDRLEEFAMACAAGIPKGPNGEDVVVTGVRRVNFPEEVTVELSFFMKPYGYSVVKGNGEVICKDINSITDAIDILNVLRKKYGCSLFYEGEKVRIDY